MNLLLTLENGAPDSALDKHFGRAPYFMIVNMDNQEKTFLENDATKQSSGAGVAAGQTVIDLHVDVAVSGHFGPKAAQTLSAAKIKMLLLNDSCQTIEDVLSAYQQGTLIEQKA
ncbi:MAG: NifB/NifX family molybdenum-iron cluster-binding protein [Anaerolineaceae bacterium]|nr:NifB/NifX family molybdenum-iron cluster-binding protein [Anaerolineaceae bacterium]